MRKLKFQNYKNSLNTSQIKNNLNYLEKKKISVDCLEKDQRKFIEKNKLILKSDQIFKSEKHKVFAEEINKIALGSNDDKRIPSIDSTETYAHGMNKDLIWKKEKIKRVNILKQYKNV